MKKEITREEVRSIHMLYGVFLSPSDLSTETVLINDRLRWEDETKTAEQICHQYAEQRAALDAEEGDWL